jgi:hypothetical protein
MPKLPVISGERAVKAFERIGWRVFKAEGRRSRFHRNGVSGLLTVEGGVFSVWNHGHRFCQWDHFR